LDIRLSYNATKGTAKPSRKPHMIFALLNRIALLIVMMWQNRGSHARFPDTVVLLKGRKWQAYEKKNERNEEE